MSIILGQKNNITPGFFRNLISLSIFYDTLRLPRVSRLGGADIFHLPAADQRDTHAAALYFSRTTVGVMSLAKFYCDKFINSSASQASERYKCAFFFLKLDIR